MRGVVRSKLRVSLLVFVTVSAAWIAERPPARAASSQYADPALCATCHADIAATFRKTGMGHSFYRLTANNVIEDLGKTFYHQASDTYLVMFERGGKYYQRRWQKGFDGKETNVDEKQVDYVMGSANHGRTYLHLSSRNTLQQLPLGWYTEKGGYWAMAPGYDRPDYPGSTRVITYECMYCHNTYPRIPPNHEETGANPQFLPPVPEGIECQRCHGPGQLHVETAGRAEAKPEEIRASIINPARLSPDRELEVCMQCHLETTAVSLPHDIRRFDRAPFSYIPGQPLGDFRLTFDRDGGMGDRFEVAHAAYRMRESQCFLKSNGSLRCTTCHDPHNIPRGEAAATHYNGVCRTCHAAAFQQTVASGNHTAAANCISCHMPKRRTEDAVYMVMTDHFIRARQPAGDLLAPRPETHDTPATAYHGKVIPYYPKNPGATALPPAQREVDAALYLAVAQIVELSNLREGLPQLQSLLERYRPERPEFYADLAEGFVSAGQPAKALPWFEEAARRASASPVILRKLGSAQMEAGRLPEAEATLRRVTALAPDDAGAWGMLGETLWREHRNTEAREALARGIAADPELPDLHGSLATVLFSEGDISGAESEFRESMRIQPNSAQVQANLGSLLASRGADAEARYHFERSIALQPDAEEAHLNYARLLASLKESDAAEKQAQAAVKAGPSDPAAHELWGTLLAAKGDVEGAVRELTEAVRLKPDFWRAQFELGVALGRNRDYAAAAEHLRAAAQGADPEAKASAADLLRRLGQ